MWTVGVCVCGWGMCVGVCVCVNCGENNLFLLLEDTKNWDIEVEEGVESN